MNDAGRDHLKIDIGDEFVRTAKTSVNLDDSICVVSRKGVELTLMKNLPKVFRLDRPLAASGVFLAFLTSFVSSDFTEHWGLSGDQWQVLFGLGCIGGALWLGWELVRVVFFRMSISELVDAITTAPGTGEEASK